MSETDSLIAVHTTVADEAAAGALADALLGAGLAACIQTHAVPSHYRWRGKVECTPEILMVIKTRASAWPALQTHIAAHHPYDEPELLALPVMEASPGYAAWVRENTGG